MRKLLLIHVVMIFLAGRLSAQHEHNMPAQNADTMDMKQHSFKAPAKKKADTINAQHREHAMQMMPPMSHAYSRNLPMSRNASGTAWLPDASPMYMYMTGKKAAWMVHGNIFLRYTNTDIFNSGARGHSNIDAPNWIMAMMSKQIGRKGLLSAKAMLSADVLTEGNNGYPLLFQSGETFNGKRLVDRQHPHDVFSELSIGYTYAFNRNTDVFVYAGYPGEPALGAPAFMHRISSMNNPDAPLSHHWQDATHITFGVTTLGLRYRDFKLEGSAFTGREPGEIRYNFDEPKFDSYSYRVSYNPSVNWALQFSQGFIKEPEKLEPGVDVIRTTASILYSGKISRNKQLDAALAWGYNDRGAGHKEHAVLLENNYRMGKSTIYNRYEFVQKSSGELDIEDEIGHGRFDIHALTFGYNRSMLGSGIAGLAAGMQATLNFPAREMKPLYGRFPVGFQVYLQFRPNLHTH